MKSKKFISIVEFDAKKESNFEHPKGKSVTVEGESYTVKELMQRHMRGMHLELANDTIYDEFADFDSVDMAAIRRMDPVDQANVMYELEEKAKITRSKIEEHIRGEAEKKKAEAKAKARRQKDEDVGRGRKEEGESEGGGQRSDEKDD